MIEFNLEKGSNKGDNFTCTLVTVKVTARINKGQGQSEEVFNYMAKCVPGEKLKSEYVRKVSFFIKYANVQKQILCQQVLIWANVNL